MSQNKQKKRQYAETVREQTDPDDINVAIKLSDPLQFDANKIIEERVRRQKDEEVERIIRERKREEEEERIQKETDDLILNQLKAL